MSAPTEEYDPTTKTLTCWVTPDEYWSMMETRAPREIEPHAEAWALIMQTFTAHLKQHGHITLQIATVYMGADAMLRAQPSPAP